MNNPNTCELCQLVNHRNIYTQFHFENDDFIIVNCNTCNVPMVVLKHHRSSFHHEEKKQIGKILISIFGSQGYIDWKQRKIPAHAHCHLRMIPFPNSEAELLSKYV